jgi:hypothetical protein
VDGVGLERHAKGELNLAGVPCRRDFSERQRLAGEGVATGAAYCHRGFVRYVSTGSAGDLVAGTPANSVSNAAAIGFRRNGIPPKRRTPLARAKKSEFIPLSGTFSAGS